MPSPSAAAPQTIYQYDSTLEGFLTCIFTAFERKETPFDIVEADRAQGSLFACGETIETDEGKALRVHEGIAKRLGADEARHVRLAFLSDAEGRELAILRYLQIAMRRGRYTFCDHANDIVAAYERLWSQVAEERHRMIQFARFSEVEGGVYFARINPNANVVPVLMDHFAARFNTQRFVIYDEVHRIAGIHADGQWSLVRTDDVTVPEATEREAAYSAMWRSFYDAICNRERLNPALRRSFMPKRLWCNITEMQ